MAEPGVGAEVSQQITMALTKGRILGETLPLLARAGIEPLEDPGRSRKLVFETSREGLRLVIIRGTDVPTYVAHGAADIGVVGKDILLEHGAEGLYEPLDLGIARCRLMTAGPPDWQDRGGRVRVATSSLTSPGTTLPGAGCTPRLSSFTAPWSWRR